MFLFCHSTYYSLSIYICFLFLFLPFKIFSFNYLLPPPTHTFPPSTQLYPPTPPLPHLQAFSLLNPAHNCELSTIFLNLPSLVIPSQLLSSPLSSHSLSQPQHHQRIYHKLSTTTSYLHSIHQIHLPNFKRCHFSPLNTVL